MPSRDTDPIKPNDFLPITIPTSLATVTRPLPNKASVISTVRNDEIASTQGVELTKPWPISWWIVT